jgi:hypothetical protein
MGKNKHIWSESTYADLWTIVNQEHGAMGVAGDLGKVVISPGCALLPSLAQGSLEDK